MEKFIEIGGKKFIEIGGINFKILNPCTKLAKGFTEKYNCTKAFSVYDIYKKPSSAKQSAEKENRYICNKMNGEYFRILGGNSNTFSCGWLGGNSMLLFISTHKNYYVIPANRYVYDNISAYGDITYRAK